MRQWHSHSYSYASTETFSHFSFIFLKSQSYILNYKSATARHYKIQLISPVILYSWTFVKETDIITMLAYLWRVAPTGLGAEALLATTPSARIKFY